MKESPSGFSSCKGPTFAVAYVVFGIKFREGLVQAGQVLCNWAASTAQPSSSIPSHWLLGLKTLIFVEGKVRESPEHRSCSGTGALLPLLTGFAISSSPTNERLKVSTSNHSVFLVISPIRGLSRGHIPMYPINIKSWLKVLIVINGR